MDKQKAADLLQKQLDQIPSLYELTPESEEFELWKENCKTIFKEIFPEEQRFFDCFDWYSFRVNRIKLEDEAGLFTEEDKKAYLKGLQRAGVSIKAALQKLKLFGFLPKTQINPFSNKGINLKIINNLTNEQTTNLTVSFDQIIQTINDSNHSVSEKEEARAKVKDLEQELTKENPAWERIKSILKWLINFGKDVFMQVLPYLLEKYKMGG